MTTVARPKPVHALHGAPLRSALSEIAGRILSGAMPLSDLESPLWLQGLDSIGAVELLLAIEERLGVALDAETLVMHPSVEAIARHIEGGVRRSVTPGFGGTAPDTSHGEASRRRMQRDAILPVDIRPGKAQTTIIPSRILLTGATGFLGAYLLDALLRETTAQIICLLRPHGMDPCARVLDALTRYALDTSELPDRVRCVTADLAADGLGLTASTRAELSESVDTIFHAAADVDWVSSYDALRDANVVGTRELLRIACARTPAAFHFVSSMAVCYATTGPHDVCEGDDPLTNLDGLHLGYAQSKCIAEALVRTAAHRGLSATIHRPALIFGDSRTGASPTTDLVATLLKGCIELGAAPDLDWTMDCVAPDFAARAIVRLSFGKPDAGMVTHLINDRARHWRECVLWMQLAGYPLRLLPYGDWAARVDMACRSGGSPLAPLRPFLLGRWREDPSLALPQLYEHGRRRHASSVQTNARLENVGLRCPPLDTSLLDRVFQRWSIEKFVPACTRHDGARRLAPSVHETTGELQDIVANTLGQHHGSHDVRIARFDARRLGGSDGIISELSSWQVRKTIGLFRCRVAYRIGGRVKRRVLLVKAKAEDCHVIEIAQKLAQLCGDRLGDAVDRYRSHLGICRGHVRELAIATQGDARFRGHIPRTLGAVQDAERGQFALVMEPVRDPILLDAADDPSRWERPYVAAAIRGLATLHSVWYGREETLRAHDWLPHVPTASRMSDASELWSALAEHAAPLLRAWGLDAFVSHHASSVETVGMWWNVLDGGPRTLIHGDANPRNLAICRSRTSGRPHLRAYDWELATVGAPQRDLAELLCFVLPCDVATREVDRWLAVHRRALSEASGVPIDPCWWRAGFAAALRDLLISRLAMYALIHRVRPLPWLERVTRTCAALCRAYPIDA